VSQAVAAVAVPAVAVSPQIFLFVAPAAPSAVAMGYVLLGITKGRACMPAGASQSEHHVNSMSSVLHLPQHSQTLAVG
jgi:hypothetical protein